MAAKFFALLTNQGAAKLSNMAALGEKLEITSLAVGDGGGVSPTPNQAQTKLVNEVRRAQLNSLSVDENNDSQIIAEQIIPESVGGWWIREIGLFDADGILIAVANCPETYKATTEEGSGRTQVIRMMLTVSSTDAVTLKVDPSVVLATRQYVDSAVIEVKTYADNVMKKHVAAENPHSQYPLIENALKELADAGLVSEVLKNLGLGNTKYGAPLIGQLIEWPLQKMPHEIWPDMGQEYIPYMAQSFDPVKYPLLSQLHPTNVLPADMRAYVARGWDNGRGVDTGRALMSAQSSGAPNLTGTVQNVVGILGAGSSGAALGWTPGGLSSTAKSGTDSGVISIVLDASISSKEYQAITEVRVKNVAWNMIVRAK
ncbi:TPA: phage tail protein [Kluyvera ascorbata]|nr:phage tail protein [Kluyvera ascorbata]